jgi:hypothetical protein
VLGRREYGVAFDGRSVGVLNGSEPGGNQGLAGGDGLAVASAVGAFGQALAESVYFADVGFSFVGVRGDGEDGDAGGGVEDDADGLAFGVPVCPATMRGPSVSGQACPRDAVAVSGPVVEACEHDVGAVDLVAGGTEVLADRADVSAAADTVAHETGGLRVVWVGSRAGVDAQLGLQRRADRSGFDEADWALGEDRGLQPGGQTASRREVTWSTGLSRASAAAVPLLMSRSYTDSSGSSPS